MRTCAITLNSSGRVELSVAAIGQLLLLMFSAQAFSGEKREESILMRTKTLPPLKRIALASNETYAVTLDRDVDAYLLEGNPLIVTIKGKDYSFSTLDASSAIDAVRRCVGQPTKAELQAKKAPPFPMPAGWTLRDDIGNSCAARLEGSEISTTVSINSEDQVLLVAGRRDWATWGENFELTLQFDSQPPRPFKASRWNNLLLLLLVDDADVTALRNASTLKWHLPIGDYTAQVHDVGAALDSAIACTKTKRKGASR